MKKFIVTFALLLFAVPAHAGFVSTEGDKVCNISDVLKMRDNDFVVVQGNITKQVGDEKYILKDGKSEIIVDIDDNLWSHITVSPSTKVKITGEVDRDFNSIKLDASRVEIVK